LLDTYRAIDLLEAGPADARGVMEETISTGETNDYHFTVDAPQTVRLTMVWTDPPGTPPAPSLDPPNKMLVNDLDLRITSVNGAVTTLPWTLDGFNPSAAAVRADNSTDNVESIDIDLAPADQYVVHVTHKGTLLSGSQAYALVWQGMKETAPTGVVPAATPPFALSLPTPHPIRTRSTIGYRLDHTERVSIRVYDVMGRRVATLLETAARAAGPGSVQLDARALPSGVYFVKMESRTQSVTRKITILK